MAERYNLYDAYIFSSFKYPQNLYLIFAGPVQRNSKKMSFIFWPYCFKCFTLSIGFGIEDLRRPAANDNIFKLFFLHPFLAPTIYNNTIKNKFDIG